MWYTRGFKRPGRWPNLRWGHDIRKHTETTLPRKPTNKDTWAEMEKDYVRQAKFKFYNKSKSK